MSDIVFSALAMLCCCYKKIFTAKDHYTYLFCSLCVSSQKSGTDPLANLEQKCHDEGLPTSFLRNVEMILFCSLCPLSSALGLIHADAAKDTASAHSPAEAEAHSEHTPQPIPAASAVFENFDSQAA